MVVVVRQIPQYIHSSSARKLPWKMRPDLSIERQTNQGKEIWVVKDPIGLKYFRFLEEEFKLLSWLDGNRSLDDLRQCFEDYFAPQTTNVQEMWHFVSMLHENNLVVSNVAGQGTHLQKRHDESRWRDLKGCLSNVLAIRFKGIDPDRFLTWLHATLRWFFTPAAVVISGLLGLAALLLITVHWATFQSRLPLFHEFFAAVNWAYLAGVLIVTKILHEFGHGLACKHFGCECHEMGLLLLVFTPCLFCDVSDSWRLPNKWRRAAIGAAGMYIELYLASLATFVWWFSARDSALSNICLCTMFVSSVSTLVFNANPLMRYDGYFILSDLAEIPNLREKAVNGVSKKARQYFFETEERDNPYLPERYSWFFAGYAIAATIYGWFVTASVLWFLQRVLKPYRLQVLGQILAAFALWALVAVPLGKAFKYMATPGRITVVKKPRLWIAGGFVFALLAGVIWVPLPHHVSCLLELHPREAISVYVTTPGRLDRINTSEGTPVLAGTVLGTLHNGELAQQMLELIAKKTMLDSQIKSVNFYTGSAASDARRQLRQMQEALRSIQEQIVEKQREQDFLSLAAPVAGTVLPPPVIPSSADDEALLPTWSGSPLEPQNLGAWLPTRTLFCQIGNPAKWEAILLIDQADMDFVRVDQEVAIKLDGLPHRTFVGKISAISPADLKRTPHEPSQKNAGANAAKSADSAEHSTTISYEARVPLNDDELLFLRGIRGRAKIDAQNLSLGDRLWRYLSHTFRFSP